MVMVELRLGGSRHALDGLRTVLSGRVFDGRVLGSLTEQDGLVKKRG